MNAPEVELIKRCPNCKSERPASELICLQHMDGSFCHWDLSNEPLISATVPADQAEPSVTGAAVQNGLRTCRNGHPMEAGDELCVICGADVARTAGSMSTRPEQPGQNEQDTVEEAAPETETVIDGWRLVRRLQAPTASAPFQSFLAAAEGGNQEGLLVLYNLGAEPDQAVFDVLRATPAHHVPRLFATGKYNGCTYEVSEYIQGDSLQSAGFIAAGRPELLRELVTELTAALASFSDWGLRHRDLHPGNIRIRSLEPLDLVISGFGSARLSDYDLEAVAPLELTRYSAPEAIVGAVSAASDWWSLGMIVLEQATAGRCFEGVNDQAFRLHVVTRGVSLPEDLAPDVSQLLRGLLARDPLARWSARQVRLWLAGEAVEAPVAAEAEGLDANAPTIALAGRSYSRPTAFALAAAEPANWQEAKGLVLGGTVTTWLEEAGANTGAVSDVRQIASDADIDEDFRHALALMSLNSALPLTMQGEIVTPAWLLAHPVEGYSIIAGDIVRHLERMGREEWLVRLASRAEGVRERAKLLEIELDEERLKVALLASSRASLQAERDAIRQIFPDSDHPGLASVLDRSQLSDEDLIILVSAVRTQYLPLASLTDAASELAGQVAISLDSALASELLAKPRREVFEAVDQRTANFARCQIERIDDWADSFRVERRMPLPRAAVLLAVPADRWKEPPKQQYVKTLLDHFEKRVSGGVSRGPLVRFVIGKTTPRLDLFELGTGMRSAEALLNHVLARDEAPVPIDPTTYTANEQLDTRLRRLVSHASTFRRDTGLDGRTLGFPFLLIPEAGGGASKTKAKFLPVLLWPVAIDLEGAAGSRAATLAFDKEREEVRLNPALESVLGPQKIARWRAARESLLGRSSIKMGDVMDAFGGLAAPRARALARLPSLAATSARRSTAPELIPAAALFNAEFTGQSVSADLRDIARRSVSKTALDALIRVSEIEPTKQPGAAIGGDSFGVVLSDPSQDAAIIASRAAPGLVVEGPPGTGKSQTIVNVVSDAIGRGETVLVVCQKQPALQVVKKRLDAEGLTDRLFMVVDLARDREAIIRALREQLAEVRNQARAHGARRERDEALTRVKMLEGEIDRHHLALHEIDQTSGHTYREILGRLVQIKAEGQVLDVPALRTLLGSLDTRSSTEVVEACAPLANLWLSASYEGSALHVLKTFPADDALVAEISGRLQAYVSCEQQRQQVLGEHANAFDTDDPEPLIAWVQSNRAFFRQMSADEWARLAKWLALFKNGKGTRSSGEDAIGSLTAVLRDLDALDQSAHDDILFAAVVGLPGAVLRQHLIETRVAAQPPTFWSRFKPSRWRAVRRSRRFLEEIGQPTGVGDVMRLRNALALEERLRPMRERFNQASKVLDIVPATGLLPLADLQREVGTVLRHVEATFTAAKAVAKCPRVADAESMALAGDQSAFVSLINRFEGARARYQARQDSLKALGQLTTWFSQDWASDQARAIDSSKSSLASFQKLLEALPTLEAFQRFRLRAATLPPLVLQTFASLHPLAMQFKKVPVESLSDVVRRTLHYAVYFAWKGRIETSRPALLLHRAEIEQKVEALAREVQRLRNANKQVLWFGVDGEKLSTARAWEDITRLRGPRARRLRELIDEGLELGLMHLRPVWLMNPDVASRVLPLKAGLFDLVIYDEASQMLVEHALPTLFRARRVLISGDEKQMPPSAFFSSRIDGDESDEGDLEDLEEGITESERAAKVDAWNKREVKDCPDLLQLGRSILPKSTLQIHYRSRYRELISFSNSAYYQGSLSIPVRHPDSEIKRVRPVEVVRVNGIYEGQTNQAEAKAVVELLARFWSSKASETPTLGVVTFNRKQADEIDDAIELRVLNDTAFAAAYRREKDRTQNGEDMGFFVKNVENVQGDERDVIIFSTTFGRDRHGTFRRNFGVLSQTGGERRLNVAVTRARDKVVLVTSMPLSDVSDWLSSGRQMRGPRDYLQAYLYYAEQISGGDLELARTAIQKLSSGPTAGKSREHVADGFTRSVEEYVRSLGHEPIVANDGDAFGLDFAVENSRSGLFAIGIECDAPRHPLLQQARAREIWRPSVLKSAIGSVHRVSSYDWFHRPYEEQARLAAAVRAALN